MIRTARTASILLAATIAFAKASPALAQSGANPTQAALTPGDKLLLKIWLDSSYVDTVRVDQLSQVVLPRVGMCLCLLAGLQSSKQVPIRFAPHTAYGFSSRRSIEVTPLRSVGILGDVRKPDVYYIDLTTNLRDAVSSCSRAGWLKLAGPITCRSSGTANKRKSKIGRARPPSGRRSCRAMKFSSAAKVSLSGMLSP